MVFVRKENSKILIELTELEYDEFRSHLVNYLSIFNPDASDMTLEEYIVFPMSKVCTDIEEGFEKVEHHSDYINRMTEKFGTNWDKII